MSIDYDKSIKEKKDELSSLISELDEIRKRFIQVTGEFTSKWYIEQARKEIKDDPDTAEKLSDDQLKILKSRVNDLSKKAYMISNQFFSASDIWWHLQEEKKPIGSGSISSEEHYKYDVYGNRMSEILKKPVHYVLYELGKILREYGFAKPLPHLRNISSERPDYPIYYFECSDKMKEVAKQYSNSVEVASKLLEEINYLKFEKRKNQTESRWDSF